ncbi:MAG: nucleotide exchange factor GrpE [Actinomycetes bacterium]
MTNAKDDQPDPEARPRPVVRDRRRIDPQTGAVREPTDGTSPGQAAKAAVAGVAKARAVREAAKAAAHGGDKAAGGQKVAEAAPSARAPAATKPAKEVADLTTKVAELEATVAERTGDLQRVQAEYANYRKRIERDRVIVRELAVADTLTELLSVLDDIGRARDHGELEGGFKSVGESLEQAVAKLGLEKFGEVGERFDPARHEAFLHSYDDGVDEPTCSAILQPGYRIKDRIVRPARVAVTEPEPYDPSGGRTTEPAVEPAQESASATKSAPESKSAPPESKSAREAKAARESKAVPGSKAAPTPDLAPADEDDDEQ